MFTSHSCNISKQYPKIAGQFLPNSPLSTQNLSPGFPIFETKRLPRVPRWKKNKDYGWEAFMG